MIDNIVPIPSGPPALPENVMAAAKTLSDFAASQGARYWEIGLTCSRLYAMGVQSFAPNLKKIRSREKDSPDVHAHNAAVAALKQMSERKADETLFKLLKEASGK